MEEATAPREGGLRRWLLLLLKRGVVVVAAGCYPTCEVVAEGALAQAIATAVAPRQESEEEEGLAIETSSKTWEATTWPLVGVGATCPILEWGEEEEQTTLCMVLVLGVVLVLAETVGVAAVAVLVGVVG
jgi:hypothetical protein